MLRLVAKKIALNLIDILENQDEDADLDVLVGHLKKINTHFDQYDIENVHDEEALFELIMTEEQVDLVVIDVDNARAFIING